MGCGFQGSYSPGDRRVPVGNSSSAFDHSVRYSSNVFCAPSRISRVCLPVIFCGIIGGAIFALAGEDAIAPIIVGTGLGFGAAVTLVGVISTIALIALGFAITRGVMALFDSRC